MNNGNEIVVTAYGHNKTIDKISAKSFEYSDAEAYCTAINSLELKDDLWVNAKIISEKTQYPLDAFFPVRFSDLILKMEGAAIQKVFRETDSQELAKSLKDQDEKVIEKCFRNMSKRASQMLKEDMECMGTLNLISVKESQEKIISIIRYLEECGEIVIQQ